MNTDVDHAEEYEVVIIGAGINGAGLFHDLCLQGIKCLLIEKSDFGSGTSAAPSRLIHGGLKYLETGEFRLVRESTFERNLLLKNAPHLVKPLPTIIPVRSWANGIWSAAKKFMGAQTAFKSRGAILIKIGLSLYDLFGRKERTMPKHEMFGRRRALQKLPALTPSIVGTGLYYDAMITSPERLILELIEDACTAEPTSKAVNWAALVSSNDGTLGFQSFENAEFFAKPKIVINAAGPWIDTVNQILGEDTQLIGGNKGSHIVIDHDELVSQLGGHMVYFEGDDGRILLVFPYQCGALVGSTDIPADNPDDLSCSDEEIDYFMSSLRMLFPALKFDEDQILFSYAGIRPLPNSEGVAPGLVSRDHSSPIIAASDRHPYPIISLVGGKWTTYRGFAQSVADTVLIRLGKLRKHSTILLKIGGGRNFPDTEASHQSWIEEVSRQTALPADRLGTLLERYGTKARTLASHIAEFPGNRLLTGSSDYCRGEIDWISRNERVLRLEDILLRRTHIAITGQASLSLIADVSEIVGKALHWSEDKLEREVASVIKSLTDHHRITFQ